MTKELKPVSTNTDRDEGSSVVVEERKRLKELRAKLAEQESCVLFFCKECNGIVTVNKHPKKYSFSCNLCNGKQVAFGTDVSIRKFFHLKEDTLPVTEEDYRKRMIEDAEREKEWKARQAERDEREKAQSQVKQ